MCTYAEKNHLLPVESREPKNDEEFFLFFFCRIDKDVQRCDRNYWYFTLQNLEKLRNVMCSYVWENLEIG